MEFLDTNVILRYLTKDDEAKAEACYELFEQARQGDKALFTCEAIIAEVVYVLSSP
ncbi:MAG: PIN domain-containing protein, partial [Chloroflexi bacterium]|nr:PIN domain-containing protein [Chloroflexota bacterium]